jgi:GH43 family beta-xylosidase
MRLNRPTLRLLTAWLGLITALFASAGTFTNPIVSSGADPWVIQHGADYFLCQSRGRSVYVTRAASPVEIGKNPSRSVWTPPRGTPYSREIWAPELHYLQNKWFVYVAADDGTNANHRMYVLEGSSQNPQDPFVFCGELKLPGDRWAIDGTVLSISNRMYFVWSGWEGTENVDQRLYIARMQDPLTVTGDRVCISRPEHDWEQRGRPWVNEGPQALWHDGRLFIIYSASGSWGDDYCLGQLTFAGGDPLQAESWIKKPAPVFARTPDVFGPGHCSFVKSPDGTEDWILYHAAKHRGAGWNRDVRAQKFTWNADGAPHFGAPVPPGEPLALPAATAKSRLEAVPLLEPAAVGR